MKCCKNCQSVYESHVKGLVCCSAESSGNPSVEPNDSCNHWSPSEQRHPEGYRKAEEVAG